MDHNSNEFLEKQKQQQRITHWQKEIEELLKLRPELNSIQKDIEAKLDKMGDPHTKEGQFNRMTCIYSLLHEAVLELQNGLEIYRSDLVKTLKSNNKLKSHLRLVEPEL